jgi:hypothetical protein
MVALADLDRLLIASTEVAAVGTSSAPGGELAVVAPAHREVESLLTSESETIAALARQIGG